MHSGHQAVINGAIRIADELPGGLVHALARAIEGLGMDHSPSARSRLLQLTPQPRYRAVIGEFLDTWRSQAPQLSRESAALALLSAAATVKHCAEEEVVEPVWGGPAASGVPAVRADQALVRIAAAAERSLLVAGFSVWKIPGVVRALADAAGRGVALSLCVEPAVPGAELAAVETVEALGTHAPTRAAVYTWPAAGRPTGPNGRTGVLAAKCAVADGRHLFLSSADLNPCGAGLDIELGILVHGGDLPAAVARQFHRLMENGTLKRAW